MFVTLEGGDGSGKSTQARLLTERLRAEGYDVCLTQEPAGTAIGRLVKGILEGRPAGAPPLAAPAPLSPEVELFLFEAARADHVRTVIRPALDAGRVVISDRFSDSTFAYQGYGRGLALDDVRRLDRLATAGLTPDLTVLLDVPAEIGVARADSDGKTTDAIGGEALEFHRRVREGFLSLANQDPARWVIIDATGPADSVAAAVFRRVLKTIEERAHARA